MKILYEFMRAGVFVFGLVAEHFEENFFEVRMKGKCVEDVFVFHFVVFLVRDESWVFPSKGEVSGARCGVEVVARFVLVFELGVSRGASDGGSEGNASLLFFE